MASVVAMWPLLHTSWAEWPLPWRTHPYSINDVSHSQRDRKHVESDIQNESDNPAYSRALFVLRDTQLTEDQENTPANLAFIDTLGEWPLLGQTKSNSITDVSHSQHFIQIDTKHLESETESDKLSRIKDWGRARVQRKGVSTTMIWCLYSLWFSTTPSSLSRILSWMNIGCISSCSREKTFATPK